MVYENQGNLLTDKQVIETAFEWNTQTEWEANQAQNNIAIENGILSLTEVFPTPDLWFDATELTGFSASDPVGTWPDEIGNNDLTQTTGSNQPTYQTGVIGGNPIVRFDGVNDTMAAAFSDLTQPNTIFIVTSVISTGTASVFLSSNDDSSARNQLWKDTDDNAWQMYAGNALAGGTPDSDPHIFTAFFDGSDSFLQVDNTTVIDTNAGTQALSGLRLGAQVGPQNHAECDIGEVLIYDRDLTSQEYIDVESYLSDKWGIALA